MAIRGFLVQTLVALLDILQSDTPFSEITLEPDIGNQQFDFLWKDGHGAHATQVKSTVNSFSAAEVKRWAARLESASTNEHCRLILVGRVSPKISSLKRIGTVEIETRDLNLSNLVEQAAHRLARFLESEDKGEGTASERVMIIHALTSKLEHLSIRSTPLSRTMLVRLLTEWICSVPKSEPKINVSRISHYAPEELVGREVETQLLFDSWNEVTIAESKRPRILTFVAVGGEGKTSLVAKWLADLARDGWPGCDAAFAWSFYSQGAHDREAASSDLFLKEALTFFGDNTDKQLAASGADSYEKGQRLARIVGQQRCLLILDGIEPLQYTPTWSTPGKLKDRGIAALLKGLAGVNRGLCVITTRYSVPDLQAFWKTTVSEIRLLRLSRAAGVHLLQSLHVKGSLLRNISFHGGQEREWVNVFEKLVEDVRGHALTLNLLGTFLRDAHAGDIYKRDLVKLEEADANEQGGHAFRVMEAYEREFEQEGKGGRHALAMLRLLGLSDRPLTSDCIAALLQGPAIEQLTDPLTNSTEVQRNISLKRLEDARLLTVNRDTFGGLHMLDSHPLVREYFARRLREEQPDAWRLGQKRLCEHLRAIAKQGDHLTLEDLQPIYQAVAHACKAGLQQMAHDEIYLPQIRQHNNFYSIRKLGALSEEIAVLLNFFDEPWTKPHSSFSEEDRAMLLGNAAGSLRAVGRLVEALAPARTYFEWTIQKADWKQAALGLNTISEIELLLGILLPTSFHGSSVEGAVSSCKQAIAYADRSKDLFIRTALRTMHGNVLLQTGNTRDAGNIFREAEVLQRLRQPKYALLYSVAGAHYCDFLLVDVERAAWRRFTTPNALIARAERGLPKICGEVKHRATKTLEWSVKRFGNSSLLDVALDHLTLGRIALFMSIFKGVGDGDATQIHIAKKHLDEAVCTLRRAGYLDYFIRGLLTRAWLRTVTNVRTGPESAQADLDEAWEIAERGPMRLYMVDIYLYRARLFFQEHHYPWESARADLMAAEELINACSYHRRDEEIADAKLVILE